jgi:uncharacterized membrane protein YfcA
VRTIPPGVIIAVKEFPMLFSRSTPWPRSAPGRTGMHLDWAVVGPFTAAAVLGAWDGKRLAKKVRGRTLQTLFAYVLLAVALFMLADALVP